eukprot:6192431-Pleurochrysis_carterae.AAC.8
MSARFEMAKTTRPCEVRVKPCLTNNAYYRVHLSKSSSLARCNSCDESNTVVGMRCPMVYTVTIGEVDRCVRVENERGLAEVLPIKDT